MKSLLNSKWGFLLPFTLPLATVLGALAGGYFNFTTVVIVFIIIPLVDSWIGSGNYNYTESEIKSRDKNLFFDNVLVLWVLVQTLFLFWSLYHFSNVSEGLPQLGFVLSVGLVTGGIGITVAHELGHKISPFKRVLSQFLLMQVFYMHFYVEHNKGHHVLVGTPEDPATSRENENFYKFWFRSVFMGYLHAWKLEYQSLKRRRKSVISFSNKMIWYMVLPVIFGAGAIFIVHIIKGNSISSFQLVNYGSEMVFLLVQGIIAFTLLELVNYVEHYGLTRRKTGDNRYEQVSDFHSWNSDYQVSNLFLFQLQLHSDHHKYAIKKYQTLVSLEDSPQLPYGYPTMILMAMVPLLWYKKVHPILLHWKKEVQG